MVQPITWPISEKKSLSVRDVRLMIVEREPGQKWKKKKIKWPALWNKTCKYHVTTDDEKNIKRKYLPNPPCSTPTFIIGSSRRRGLFCKACASHSRSSILVAVQVASPRIWDTYCIKVPTRYLKPTHILWMAYVMVYNLLASQKWESEHKS